MEALKQIFTERINMEGKQVNAIQMKNRLNFKIVPFGPIVIVCF